jgi:hypothetical protein
MPQLSTRRTFMLQGSALVGSTVIAESLLQGAQKEASAGAYLGKAKSVIFIFLAGGLSAQESFDPKPYAPIDYRGPLSSIKTTLPGVHFSSALKQTAKQAQHLSIIRSLTHGEAAHERGVHNMMTGYRPSPALLYPSFGSVISAEMGGQNHLPSYVVIPEANDIHCGPGYLSSAFGPFSIGGNPQDKNFSVRDLLHPEHISPERYARRKKILAELKSYRPSRSDDSLRAMDAFVEKAFELMESPQAREAFNLEAEDGKTRDRYGRTGEGQQLLLARRLSEAGVRWVQVQLGGWDMHEKIKDGINQQLPKLDQAFAALIQDLKDRGRLDETLVVLSTEFGRTPKINDKGGRDHYPKVFSVCMAGGGVKGGQVIGASDATATEPQDQPVTVMDYAKSIYHLVGIDGEKELLSPGNRPIEIVKGGQLIQGLFA